MSPPRRKRNVPWAIVGLTSGAVVVLGSVIALRARSADPAPEPSSSVNAGANQGLDSVMGDPVAVPAGSGIAELDLPSGDSRSKALGAASLSAAIDFTRPMMTNTVGRIDSGSALLSIWASQKLTWDSLDAVPQTSSAMFAKDQDAERGKRLCITGTVVEIRAEKSLASRLMDDRASPLITPRPLSSQSPSSALAPDVPMNQPETPPPLFTGGSSAVGDWSIPADGKVFVATLKEKTIDAAKDDGSGRPSRRANRDELIVEVIAVKSSGSIVDRSEARACGILTGVTMPSTSSATLPPDVTVHRIVGLFDLPQNH